MFAGFVLTQVAFQLPILALMITGLVLVGTRRAQIGPRSVLFARLGLGLLVLDTVLGLAWTVLLPQLARSISYSSSRLGQVSLVYGLASTALFAGAVGLLIAAIVARPAAGGPGGPPGSAYPGPPGSTESGPQGSTYSGPPDAPYGASGSGAPQQPAGPFSSP